MAKTIVMIHGANEGGWQLGYVWWAMRRAHSKDVLVSISFCLAPIKRDLTCKN
jgi:hypothetical protein